MLAVHASSQLIIDTNSINLLFSKSFLSNLIILCASHNHTGNSTTDDESLLYIHLLSLKISSNFCLSRTVYESKTDN